MPHCCILKAIYPEQPTGALPFLLFRRLCMWRVGSASFSFSVARFTRWLLPNFSRCSLLKAARLELFPDKVRAGPSVPPSSTRAVLSTSLVSFRSCQTLENVQSLIFRSPVEGPTIRFSIFSSVVFLTILPVVPSLLTRSCRLAPQSFIPLLHSIVSSRPSVLYDRVSYAVNKRNGGSPVCGRRPTFLGPTIALGLFLRLSAVPYGYILVPIWVL
jgi:hypothetical protein